MQEQGEEYKQGGISVVTTGREVDEMQLKGIIKVEASMKLKPYSDISELYRSNEDEDSKLHQSTYMRPTMRPESQ